MRVDYKIKDKFDFTVFGSVIALVIMGFAAIYSATQNNPAAAGNFEKQIMWSLISIIVFFIIYFLPAQTFRVIALPSYVISILLLIFVLFAGHKVSGARSWMNFGPFGFQPSEFSKISVILMLSYWLSRGNKDINNIKDLTVAIAIGFVPILLILMEPDLGTAIVYSAITLGVIFWAGINLFALFVVLSPGIIMLASLFGLGAMILALVGVIAVLFYFKRNLFTSATVFVINLASGFFFDYGFKLLKPHQQKRIETFIDPSADPLGYGYNALQAKVAIGSGGFLGKGFLHGNQTQLRFIPEQWTDFI
ncbi:MAG: rod shape-determining protein RodA, partial [Ignavibacteria bacterium]